MACSIRSQGCIHSYYHEERCDWLRTANVTDSRVGGLWADVYDALVAQEDGLEIVKTFYERQPD